jgi:transcriptional regulator PpsR
VTEHGRISERFRAGVLPDPAGVDDLVEHVSDLAIMVAGDGTVTGISVNPDCPTLGCLDHWVGRPFKTFLTPESQDKFAERLSLMDSNPGVARRPVELNHVDNATWEFPIRYTLHPVGDDAGDGEGSGEEDAGGILLIGRDMQPIAEVQQRLVSEQLARERDQQRLRSGETFYRVVLEASDTPILVVEPGRGRIHDLNAAAASLLGAKQDTFSGTSLAQAFEGRKREELLEALETAAGSDGASRVQLVARRSGRDVSLVPEYFRAAGELYILCRLAADDAAAAGGSETAAALSQLFSEAWDAIVLTDANGVIREANEAFLVLTDAAQMRDVRGRSLADFLVRGSVDLKLILETVGRAGRMSRYTTQVSGVVGNRANVDISVTQLRQSGGEVTYGFIIRDVTPAQSAESEPGMAVMSDEAMKSVMDLVGTASLKELVSATSDVVEKMCIETAVKLTGNNRVAAAEMLGLSRQSLYVKLRKHGLLHSGGED